MALDFSSGGTPVALDFSSQGTPLDFSTEGASVGDSSKPKPSFWEEAKSSFTGGAKDVGQWLTEAGSENLLTKGVQAVERGVSHIAFNPDELQRKVASGVPLSLAEKRAAGAFQLEAAATAKARLQDRETSVEEKNKGIIQKVKEGASSFMKAAEEHPGAVIGSLARGLAVDPEMAYMGALTAPLKAGKVTKTVAQLGEMGAEGAAMSAVKQKVDTGRVDTGEALTEGAATVLPIVVGKALYKAVGDKWLKGNGKASDAEVEAILNQTHPTATVEEKAALVNEASLPHNKVYASNPKAEEGKQLALDVLEAKNGHKRGLSEEHSVEKTWEEEVYTAANRFANKYKPQNIPKYRQDIFKDALKADFIKAAETSHLPKEVASADIIASQRAAEASRRMQERAPETQAPFLQEQDLQGAKQAQIEAERQATIARVTQQNEQAALAASGRERIEGQALDTPSYQERAAQTLAERENELRKRVPQGETPAPYIAQEEAAQDAKAATQAEHDATIAGAQEANALSSRVATRAESVESNRAINPVVAQEEARVQGIKNSNLGLIPYKNGKRAAVVGGGALLGATTLSNATDEEGGTPESPLSSWAQGAMIGSAALVGLALAASKGGKLIPKSAKEATKTTVKELDKVAGQMGTRIDGVSPEVGRHTLNMFRQIKRDTHSNIAKADPFLSKINEGSTSLKDSYKGALLNGNLEGVAATLTGDAKTSFDNVRETLRQLAVEAADRNIIRGSIENYFPRAMKDREGFLQSVGSKERGEIETLLEAAATKNRRPPTPEEEAAIIDQYMRSAPIKGGPGFSKSRTVGEIGKDQLKYYHDPIDTYHSYVERMTREIHMSDFFGKSAKIQAEGGLDVEASLGAYVQDLRSQGKLTPEKITELKELMDTQFKSATEASGVALDLYRNATTALVLGNAVSSLMNLGDPIMANFIYGVKPALKSTLESLKNQLGVKGEQQLSTKEYGLVDHAVSEFIGKSRSRKYVENVMKLSGWEKLDSFGKDIHFNSSLRRAKTWSESAKGIANLQERYGEAFGKDFPQLVKDLRSGEATDLVHEMAFWDVAQHQPLTPLQRTEFQLKHPTIGTFTHQFKSFMLSQANLVRKEAYNKIKEGNVSGGLKRLAGLGAGFAMVGASNESIRNFLLGRDEEFKGVDILKGAMKQVGYNEFASSKFKQGDIVGGVASYITPAKTAYDVGQSMYRLSTKTPASRADFNQQIKDSQMIRQHIPVIGPMWAARTEEGKMARMKQKIQQQKRDFKEGM